MPENTKYNVNQELLVKEIDKRSVIVDINTAKYFTFNETGDFIWKCFLENMDYEETKTAFLDEFTVSEEIFNKDYRTFICDLRLKKIIKEA
jgi:hypothetical protein